VSARRGRCALLACLRTRQDQRVKKTLLIAALLVGLAAIAKRFAPRVQRMDWQARIDAMPENAPPKWMFRNITAIRENTDRILELVDHGRPGSAEPTPAA
jgi:ribosome-associated toxin RatA of RatAB toxin-antitoxin module